MVLPDDHDNTKGDQSDEADDEGDDEQTDGDDEQGSLLFMGLYLPGLVGRP